MGGESKRKSPRWLDGPHGVGAKCELWQQSIVKSTSLVATTERLDGNTRFSSQLYNRLIYNRLSKKEENRNFLLNLLRCKTCLTGVLKFAHEKIENDAAYKNDKNIPLLIVLLTFFSLIFLCRFPYVIQLPIIDMMIGCCKSTENILLTPQL